MVIFSSPCWRKGFRHVGFHWPGFECLRDTCEMAIWGLLEPLGRKILWVDFLKHTIFWCLWSFTWPACFFFPSLWLETFCFFLVGTFLCLEETWGLTWILFVRTLKKDVWRETATQFLTPFSWEKLSVEVKGKQGTPCPPCLSPHVIWHPITSVVFQEASPPVPEAFDISAMEGHWAWSRFFWERNGDEIGKQVVC